MMRQQESATITVVDHTPMLLMPSFADDIMTTVGSRSTHLDSERSAMTSKTTTFTKGAGKLERFPDYAPREDMQNWLYLYDSGVLTSLTLHFANVPSVTVASEVPVGPSLPVRDDARIPDLLVVRDGYRELIEEQRGYAIDRQGKAPGLRAGSGVSDYG